MSMSESILAPSWGPTWLHFGPQDASKTAILGIQDALSLASYFRCLFGSIFGPSWAPSWPQLGSHFGHSWAPKPNHQGPLRPVTPPGNRQPLRKPSTAPKPLHKSPPGLLPGPPWAPPGPHFMLPRSPQDDQ